MKRRQSVLRLAFLKRCFFLNLFISARLASVELQIETQAGRFFMPRSNVSAASAAEFNLDSFDLFDCKFEYKLFTFFYNWLGHLLVIYCSNALVSCHLESSHDLRYENRKISVIQEQSLDSIGYMERLYNKKD